MRKRRPYKLPEPLQCGADKPITLTLAEEYIRQHEERFPRYIYLENLYKGFHDVYKQPEKPDWKPDNRLAVNFPRYITDTFLGFGYGVPIKKSHPDDTIAQAINDFERENEITDHEYELARKCCIYGHAFEYLYQDEEAKTKMTICTPMELFVVYDDTVKNRALFAVRYGYHSTETDQSGQRYGEILTREEIIPFEGSTAGEPMENPYGRLPCVEWMLNEDRMGLYEGVSGLVEAYNHTLGEKANDVDAFAEAYLAVLGAELDEDGIYKIRDNRVINLYGTDDAKDILVQFLQKPTADGTQENLLNRLETLIYQTSMVANISDESFGSAASGVALAYKLQAMSNLALTFDRKIEKSLRKRYKLFCSLSTNVPDRDAWRDVDIRTTRNLPKNVAEEAQTAAQLEGIVSKETQLSVLSIVPDVKKELERMEQEGAEAAESTADFRFGVEHEQ
uniref:PORTAL PROTEIN n=1 Tax=Siphoviridae sp. ct5Px37 TaxID=2826293 RepID=A0A8S5N4T6_9CAUD|nr:MAG TPA: PORTAL PROTEIN [Siphoviridae sp. ct5Px37]